ncbi:Mce-associated membrane protein [Mycolicibacterium sp. BK556]|uniref:mammalian cell entry protein n=1 Tax=Mycobacteriaceae TaxID=1762 RepID=UPI0010611852|nr:mammalian cell entry protein [Mycobacterium sp. BK086]MBB3600805.1 Mce-associated membrane protein [Mycolicibacterium sp. BK556]MBB3630559.1 Mce-associated membrane protein [Mycolicibacterium sp. BK607]TDO10347.1 Mce-associated membrane protein [Mycobacterium sp. BK086]
MSPRHKVEPDSEELFRLPEPQPRRWVLPLVAGLAAVMIIAAVTVSALLLVKRETQRENAIRDVAVLSFVRGFVTQYASLDPFHANDYADGILAQGTGDFAKQFQARKNEIVIQVARAEPTRGTVQAVGIERWNRDGSADVVVAATTKTTMPDGKTIESGSRWLATATKEGAQWKISSFKQVI